MKVCIATGTRAEYGLLKPLMNELIKDEAFELQVLVTGAHLSPEFGLTYRLIEADGVKIDFKVEMLLSSDTSEGIVKSMGLGMIGFADALNVLRPDLLIILGDRYEMLSLASTALIYKVPIAHLHGGELTEGAYDDSIRHAITKMSHLHFTSTESYRERVIQLGEDPNSVYNVGAIGLDNISSLPLLTLDELEQNLGIKFRTFNYLITFHPETLSDCSVEDQFRALLDVLKQQEESFFIFTKANADSDGRMINQMIDNFVSNHSHSRAFVSMGQLRYLSAMRIATAVVGNSSSGIIEAASFGVPTINIGDRQKGRIQPENVINIVANREEISDAFSKVERIQMSGGLKDIFNPYGEGKTARLIVEKIKTSNLKKLINKTFYNNGQHR